jgi:ribosome biogenesis GTPase
VGKSSIINHLLPEASLRTGAVSASSGLGRHTTTTTTLYHLPNGGHLIDSPGVREFAIWNMEVENVAYGFVEFREFIGQCKFNNCRHCGEPGCAVADAVKHGDISEERLASYRRIVDSLQAAS